MPLVRERGAFLLCACVTKPHTNFLGCIIIRNHADVLRDCFCWLAGCSNNDYVDPGQFARLNSDTGDYTDDYEPNEEGRGVSSNNMDVSSSYNLNNWCIYCRDKGQERRVLFSRPERKSGPKKPVVLGDDENYGFDEYGFEFDIHSSTDWPYSGVIWTAADSKKERVDEISIEIGGSSCNASIKISVKGREVFSDSNCHSREQHTWDET